MMVVNYARQIQEVSRSVMITLTMLKLLVRTTVAEKLADL
jgi:hypothetical protein